MAAPIILCDTAGMTNEQWLEARMHGPHGKLNYLERECEEPHESLDSLDEDQLPATEDAYMQTLFSDDPFGFTEERLAKAFSELPLMRQQILKLLFVDEMKPRDIAKLLNCSAQYVSNQKQKGLKHLRRTIEKGGDIDG